MMSGDAASSVRARNRLNPTVCRALRQRSTARGAGGSTRARTVDARSVQLQMAPAAGRGGASSEEEGESESDEWEEGGTDEEEEEEDKPYKKVLCCYCCTPHVIVMLLILFATLAVLLLLLDDLAVVVVVLGVLVNTTTTITPLLLGLGLWHLLRHHPAGPEHAQAKAGELVDLATQEARRRGEGLRRLRP